MAEHGTRTQYEYYECRCEACCAAHAEYLRKYRKANPLRTRAYTAARYAAALAYREENPDGWAKLADQFPNSFASRNARAASRWSKANPSDWRLLVASKLNEIRKENPA